MQKFHKELIVGEVRELIGNGPWDTYFFHYIQMSRRHDLFFLNQSSMSLSCVLILPQGCLSEGGTLIRWECF